jgi:hypothetical protein
MQKHEELGLVSKDPNADIFDEDVPVYDTTEEIYSLNTN